MGQSDAAVMERKLAIGAPGEFDRQRESPRQRGAASSGRERIAVGELLAVLDGGRTPVIAIHRDDAAGVRGRSTIDLTGDDVGESVVLVFEEGDSSRPIVIGRLRVDRTAAPRELAAAVDVSADGQRMIVSARRELVLRCGKASITLRKDGTVQIEGERILSRAKGANRVQGGSVQLN